jgi:transposase-like protein
VREVEGILDWLGVDRCYQAVWNWKEKLADEQSDPPTAEPSRVAVDEKQIKVDGQKEVALRCHRHRVETPARS